MIKAGMIYFIKTFYLYGKVNKLQKNQTNFTLTTLKH